MAGKKKTKKATKKKVKATKKQLEALAKARNAAIEEKEKRKEERQKRVFQYKLQGLSNSQIAKTEGVSTRTIEIDSKEIRRKMAKEYQKEIGWDRVAQYNTHAEMRVRRMWAIISDPKAKKRDILNGLRLLQQEETMSIRRDQLVGILPRDNTEQMTPIVTGDGNQVTVQHVNIYQTLMEIAQEQEKVNEQMKRQKLVGGPKK